MNRILVLFASCALLSTACQKSGSSSPSYYINADMNDTAVTFDVNAMATIDSLSGFQSLIITGNVTDPSTSQQSIYLSISNSPGDKPIGPGTYTELDISNFILRAVYNPGSTTVAYGAPAVSNPPNPLTVTITSMDQNTITGTFSGDLFYTNVSTGTFGTAKKTFTNGQFNLQITHL